MFWVESIDEHIYIYPYTHINKQANELNQRALVVLLSMMARFLLSVS